jgi:hypothetical protein
MAEKRSKKTLRAMRALGRSIADRKNQANSLAVHSHIAGVLSGFRMGTRSDKRRTQHAMSAARWKNGRKIPNRVLIKNGRAALKLAYENLVRSKIEKGLASAANGDVVSHDELKASFQSRA